MTWRDNPAIVWQDDDEDRIELVGGFLSAVETDRRVGYASGIDVTAPVSLADRVEATERWLAALGLTADNIREKPCPIEAGDIVKRWTPTLWRVLHVDGDTAMIRPVSGGGGPLLAAVDDLTHAELEPEPEWVITRDPAEVAAALDAGRIVQYEAVGGWFDATRVTADECRQRRAPFGEDLRYEGPAIEAPPVRCTPDNLHLRPEDR